MTDPTLRPCQKCAAPGPVAGPTARIDDDWAWQQIVARIPLDLEMSARTTGALQRRRGIGSAADLLRVVLLYTLIDWSFRVVGAWACARGLADISDVAIRKRVRGTLAWLQLLVSVTLAADPPVAPADVCVRLIDATTAQRPGSTGTDWRLHLRFHLAQATIGGVEVTDAHAGETLARHPSHPDEISVADRGYAHRRGIGAIVAEGGQVVVRANWQNLPLQEDAGQLIDLIGWLRQVPSERAGERTARVVTPSGTVPVRVIARRLSQEAADAARRRIRQDAKKHGRIPDRRTLEAAGFLIVVTTLAAEAWSAADVLALYRFRWQIELVFKRLKGILDLDDLRMQDPELAQVYLHGKILAMLLLQREQQSAPLWHSDWLAAVDRPVSPWRCLVVYAEVLRDAVRGRIDGEQLRVVLSRLGRYLRDTPRRRPQQAAHARAFLTAHSLSSHHTTPPHLTTGVLC